MKLNAALAKSLLLAASVGMVIPIYAETTVTPAPSTPTPAKPPAKTPPVSTTKPPAKPAKPAKPAPAPAPAPETPADIQLPGIVQPRPSGGFLSLEVVDGKFKISFYDAKKKPVAADVARAAAHWRTNRKITEEHAVFNPSSDGKSLVSAGFARPPFVFGIRVNLLNEEGTAVESYLIDMRSGDPRAPGSDATAEAEPKM